MSGISLSLLLTMSTSLFLGTSGSSVTCISASSLEFQLEH